MRVYAPSSGRADAESVSLPDCVRREIAADGSAAVWTPTVDGESFAIEFYLPKGVATAGLRVAVPALSHLEVEPKRIDLIRNARCPNHIDAACRTDLVSGPARRSVANYLFTTRYGKTSTCTGSLPNDSDPATQIPYFLTADHCVSTQTEASSMEFHWFFEREECGGTMVRSVRTTGGATLLASARGLATDFALLRLNESPPNGVGLSGWTTASVSLAKFTNVKNDFLYLNNLRCRKRAYGTTNAGQPECRRLKRSSCASPRPTNRCRAHRGSPAVSAPAASPCARARCARRPA